LKNTGEKMKHIPNIKPAENGLSLNELERIARRGTEYDVSVLLSMLTKGQSMLNLKKVDYCLGLVETAEGMTIIRQALFSGNRIQRNYAALYFKRKNEQSLLEQAVEEGCIDEIQAYSR
jgi:hypothetical protein